MQIEFDEGTLLLCDAPDGIPYAEWDDRLDQDDPIQSIEGTARAYPDLELDRIRQADVENLLLAVSENLDCTSEDIDLEADRVLWFKTGIHV